MRYSPLSGDLGDGPVELFNADVQLVDGRLELFDGLHRGHLLFLRILDLGEQLVDLSLELLLFLLGPGWTENEFISDYDDSNDGSFR